MTQTISNTQVKTILAKYKGNPLHEAADSCNRGTTSDVRFYANEDNTVSVSKIYGEMSEKEQKEHLSWFLSSRTFEYIK